MLLDFLIYVRCFLMIKYIEDFHLIAKVSIPTSLKFEEYVMNMSIDVVNDMLSRYKLSIRNTILRFETTLEEDKIILK